MEELEDRQLGIPRVPLHSAKESSEIRRSEVFCSKIIHQRSTHQIRFRRQSLYLKLVRHSHPECGGASADGSYPRPLSSPFPCFQCHRLFKAPPIFIPTEMLDRRIEEYGNFCSAPCANTYMDHNMRDSSLATRIADFFEYMQDVHGFRGTEIGFAPHFSQHVNYGGDLTDAQFDAIINIPGLTTHIRMKPYIPTDAVIEWQFNGNDQELPHAVAVAAQDASAVGVSAGAGAGAGAGAAVGHTDVLASVMRSKAPEADHHHRWDATNLKQPPMEEIEERLAGLPQLPQTTGLYELYLQRKGGIDAPISDDDEGTGVGGAGAHAARPRKKNTLPSVTPGPPPAPTATTISFASLLTPIGKPASKKRRKNQHENGAAAAEGEDAPSFDNGKQTARARQSKK